MWEEVYFSQLQEAKICLGAVNRGGAQGQRDFQYDGFYFLFVKKETNHPIKSEAKSEADWILRRVREGLK